MPILCSEILEMTKGLLNDPNGAIYPDDALIPFVSRSYRELQTKVAALGISTTKEIEIDIPMLQGTNALVAGGGLPDDLIYPMEVSERALGSSDEYEDMTEREWDGDTKPGTKLGVWTWREDCIRFVGATADREVRIRYVKALSKITQPTDPILILNSEVWLSQRTGALAALLLGSNPSRAKALMDDLGANEGAWTDLKATLVKRTQNMPVRRRRTRWRRL